jgi:hypothetical protein
MAKTIALKEFKDVFPVLVEDVIAHTKQYGVPEQALDWYKAVSNLYYHSETLLNISTPGPECKYRWWQMQPWHVGP